MSDPAAPIPPEPAPEPAAAAAQPVPPATPPPPSESAVATGGTGLQPNIAATLATFFLLLGGIVFLIVEKKDQYVRFYAMQSVFLGGLSVAFSVALEIALLILHGIPLVGTVFWLASLIVRLGIFAAWVMLVYKAYSGKEWEIPVLGKLARQQLAGGGPKPF